MPSGMSMKRNNEDNNNDNNNDNNVTHSAELRAAWHFEDFCASFSCQGAGRPSIVGACPTLNDWCFSSCPSQWKLFVNFLLW